jgi:hypothetical protein
MKKSLLLATAALVLGTTAAGVALATPHLLEERFARVIGGDDAGSAVSAGERFRVADRDHRRREEARRHHRKHHDDDDDDDDDDDEDDRGDRGRGRADGPGVTGPSDPATPVPDNGLFQGKARPKVEVN